METTRWSMFKVPDQHCAAVAEVTNLQGTSEQKSSTPFRRETRLHVQKGHRLEASKTAFLFVDFWKSLRSTNNVRPHGWGNKIKIKVKKNKLWLSKWMYNCHPSPSLYINGTLLCVQACHVPSGHRFGLNSHHSGWYCTSFFLIYRLWPVGVSLSHKALQTSCKSFHLSVATRGSMNSNVHPKMYRSLSPQAQVSQFCLRAF